MFSVCCHPIVWESTCPIVSACSRCRSTVGFPWAETLRALGEGGGGGVAAGGVVLSGVLCVHVVNKADGRYKRTKKKTLKQ